MNVESMYNMLNYELDQLLMDHIPERYCFIPLGVIISSHHHEPMPFSAR
jgi:uncharacterized protein YqgQ